MGKKREAKKAKKPGREGWTKMSDLPEGVRDRGTCLSFRQIKEQAFKRRHCDICHTYRTGANLEREDLLYPGFCYEVVIVTIREKYYSCVGDLLVRVCDDGSSDYEMLIMNLGEDYLETYLRVVKFVRRMEWVDEDYVDKLRKAFAPDQEHNQYWS